MTSTIIIGAGASGLMAANQLGKTDYLILEKGKPGQKILAAGGGRCNFAPRTLSAADYTGHDPRIIRQLSAAWGIDDTLDFFRKRGCIIMREDERYYPASEQGRTILDILLHDTAGHLTAGVEVKNIEKKGELFRLTTSAGPLEAQSVIVSTGGPAAPQLGGNSQLFTVLKKLGHTVNPLAPALTNLHFSSPWLRIQSGYSLEVIISDNQKKHRGPVLFTHHGLSGPLVFDHAHTWQGPLIINFLPDYPEEKLISEAKTLHIKLREYLTKFFSLKFATGLIGHLDITEEWLDHLPREQREKLIKQLYHYEIHNYAAGGWAEAQGKSGGVPTAEIDPKTMESKIIPGLYLTGEVLDITGRCGGFNLAWAWMTGAIAGRSISV